MDTRNPTCARSAVDQEFGQAERYLQACAEIHRTFELIEVGRDHLQRRGESQARVEQALAVSVGVSFDHTLAVQPSAFLLDFKDTL